MIELSIMNVEEWLTHCSPKTCGTEDTCESSSKKNSMKIEPFVDWWSEKRFSWVQVPTKDSSVCKIEHQ